MNQQLVWSLDVVPWVEKQTISESNPVTLSLGYERRTVVSIDVSVQPLLFGGPAGVHPGHIETTLSFQTGCEPLMLVCPDIPGPWVFSS